MTSVPQNSLFLSNSKFVMKKKTHKKEFKQKRWNSKNYEFIQLTDWHFVDVNFSPTPDTKAIIIFEFL